VDNLKALFTYGAILFCLLVSVMGVYAHLVLKELKEERALVLSMSLELAKNQTAFTGRIQQMERTVKILHGNLIANGVVDQ
jgi:hypothetical protein